MTLLKTRSGPVSDLVAAERAVAAVQEEIDAASSWLAEARGRVDMSAVEIGYVPSEGFGGRLGASSGSMLSVLIGSVQALALLVATLLPWAVVGGAIVLAVRAVRRRYRPGDVD